MGKVVFSLIGPSFALLLSLTGGCSSSDDDDKSAPGGNGVNDVKKACEIRLGWKSNGSTRCSYCLAAAANPPCSCSEQKSFAAKCEAQQTARSKETASCDGVETCRFNCPIGDCACLDGCYAQKDACRTATAALDGCLAEICTEECNAQ